MGVEVCWVKRSMPPFLASPDQFLLLFGLIDTCFFRQDAAASFALLSSGWLFDFSPAEGLQSQCSLNLWKVMLCVSFISSSPPVIAFLFED